MINLRKNLIAFAATVAITISLTFFSGETQAAFKLSEFAVQDWREGGDVRPKERPPWWCWWCSARQAHMDSVDHNYRRWNIWGARNQSTGSFNFHRKINILPNIVIGWGGSNFWFKPGISNGCQGFSYQQPIIKNVTVFANVQSCKNGDFKASVTPQLFIPIPLAVLPVGPFFLAMEATILANVELALTTKKYGKWSPVQIDKNPVVIGGIQMPSAVEFSVSPLAKGGMRGMIGIGVYSMANINAYGLIWVAGVKPKAGIEIGYRKINQSGSKYRHYLSLSSSVKLTSGDGTVGIQGSVPMGAFFDVNLFSWDPILSHNINLYNQTVWYKNGVFEKRT
ncbi:hypothetical protein CS022_11190 [Veronia nyctiphanis]|uniref:Uncharacterized protein n=1 Tax=Veronia nyctiphanis TaxID=1278244 RepID=A0A4Q0YQA2_9GAMM|nr:hypothetical protein [Veronia nyctiphanis]RXJ73280.1 hypothetical protein CS022_11190 [Veronia nyctiphanis]